MTELISKMRTEVEKNGTLSFARFMEMALYDPEHGYYERHRQIGRGGDFFTSVSIGSLFGELLAFQFAEWLNERGTGNAERGKTNWQIIEAGAHDGQLASDILNCLKKFQPEIFEQLDYCILEPSPRRREWQRKTLAEFSNKISWADDWSDFPRSASPGSVAQASLPAGSEASCLVEAGSFGTCRLEACATFPRFTVVFSNELFDAMPVHRLGWDAKEKNWFEWGVGWNGKDFIWKRRPEIQPDFPLPELAPELLDVLPDGFTTEVNPNATRWWTEAAQNLGNGKIIAIDYGLLAEEFFVPQRSNGTLRAFSHHHGNSDLLARPGEQDMTAHANFSALKNAGESAGLKTEALISQTKFLTRIAEESWAQPKSFGEWDASRRKQFQTLTHPEHLGRAFRVLVQSR